MSLSVIGDLRKLIVNGFVKGYTNFEEALESKVDEEFTLKSLLNEQATLSEQGGIFLKNS